MKLDIVLAGVGGQGILSIAYLIDYAALNKNYSVKQAEVHGMSQRGGAVYSHLRLADKPVMSDLIPEGQADMILSLEPLEALRYLGYLNKSGTVISNSASFVNIPNYPEEKAIFDALFALGNTLLVDAKAIASKAQVPLAQNVALLGAATPFLPAFSLSDFSPVIKKLFERKGEKVVEGNLRALDYGFRVGTFYKALVERRVPAMLAHRLMGRLDIGTMDLGFSTRFAEIVQGNSQIISSRMESAGYDLPCTEAGLRQTLLS